MLKSRSLLLALCTLMGGVCLHAQENLKPGDAGSKPKDSVSYRIGWDLGQDLRRSGFTAADFTKDDFWSAFSDALGNGKCRLDDKEMEAAVKSLREKLTARVQESAKRNLDTAKKFLDENKAKEGVIALPSGLQYKVLKAGSGKQPSLTSTVKVHYEGKLIDGTVFDSSIQRGMPAEFNVRGVIMGWTEAIQRMKVGDKWQLFIPPNLAYGEQGTPDGSIAPNSLLTFEVELLDVK